MGIRAARQHIGSAPYASALDSARSLLHQPLGEAVQTIVLSQLAEARRACAHLASEADTEALHAVRVAIRRLRSTLRAWRKPLRGVVTRRHRRRLRELQRATGCTRDADVALAWLGRQNDLGAKRGEGVAWLENELRQRAVVQRHRAREALPATFHAIQEDLEARVAASTSASRTVDVPSTTYGEALTRRLRKQGRAWMDALSRLAASRDVGEAHATRILGKRLRYLVEPTVDLVPDLKALLPHLQAWQDLLGRLNDTRVLRAEVSREARRARKAGRSTHAGLKEIRRRLRRRKRAVFKRIGKRASPKRLRLVKRAWKAAVQALASA